MSHANPIPHEELPEPIVRSPWFWLLTLIVPFAVFFFILGVCSAIERWPVAWSLPKENAAMERTGAAPWLLAERRAELKRSVERIDRAIPEISNELKFLDGAVKKEEARAGTSADAQEYVKFFHRQKKFLEDHIAFLRSDRAYYVRELGEK